MDIDSQLLEIVHDVESILPSKDVNLVRELVVHHEGGIALEILCDQLYEYELKIPKMTHAKIQTVSRIMGVEESYYRDLEVEGEFT